MLLDDDYFMQQALREAQIAWDENEVPVGAVIAYQNKIIARSHNQVEQLKDPTAHAEILAITQAASFLKSKFLHECTLYVTIEPCCMCAGALILSRIPRVAFGASDPRTGAFGSMLDVNDLKLNHRIEVSKGVLGADCADIIQRFFEGKRAASKKQPL